MKLDQIDIKILYELQKNGRITNVELAELVNLSPSPCLMRVKKLQQDGYITGYSARINVGKLGQTLWWWSSTIDAWQRTRPTSGRPAEAEYPPKPLSQD